MPPSAEPRRVRFWRSESPLVAGMVLVEGEDRLRATYSDHFVVMLVLRGAFDGWYRGAVHTHAAGAIKLKEPGEVHRDLRVHAPFTLQGALLAPETVAAAAEALGLRGPVHFPAPVFGPGAPATRRVFAMHAALVDPAATELERATRIAEALGAILGDGPRAGARATPAVRRARALLHDALADKLTLDDLAAHAGLDKFHLVRAFRAEVGLPPYEYLTHLRVSRARALLGCGARVAEVAQAVGLCDESQLHRHFRRIVGMPPGRYARQHRPIRARGSGAHSPHDRTDPPRYRPPR